MILHRCSSFVVQQREAFLFKSNLHSAINVRKSAALLFSVISIAFYFSPLFLSFFLPSFPLPDPLLAVSFAPVTVDTTQADNRRCL